MPLWECQKIVVLRTYYTNNSPPHRQPHGTVMTFFTFTFTTLDPPPFIKAEVLKKHSFWDLPLSQIFPEHISCGWPLAITLMSYVDHHIWYMIKRALSPLFSVCNHYNHIFPEHISFEQPPVIILKSYEDHHIIIWWSSYHHKGHKCLHSQSLFHFIGNFVWANFNYS